MRAEQIAGEHWETPYIWQQKENKSEVEYNDKRQELALSREDCRVLAVKQSKKNKATISSKNKKPENVQERKASFQQSRVRHMTTNTEALHPTWVPLGDVLDVVTGSRGEEEEEEER